MLMALTVCHSNRRVALALPLAVAFIAAGCSREPEPGSDTEGTLKTSSSLREERVKLDGSVWAEEVEAQEYEIPFVDLWDALRAAPGEATKILGGFPFNTLGWQSPGRTTLKDAGILVAKLDGESMQLTPVAWREWLTKLQDSGHALEQCEFHHSRFWRDAAGKRNSRLSFEFHVVNQRLEQRWILRGAVEVVWRAERENGKPVPEAIVVRDATLLTRKGSTPFAPWQVFAAETEIQPILLHDFDGDGLSEIILAGSNELYWNRQGKFEKDKLCRYPIARLKAAVLADVDNDGNVDLVAAAAQDHPVLFRGSSDAAAGAVFASAGELIKLNAALIEPQVITSGDIDRDGDVDLWLAQYRGPYIDGQMPTPYYDANDGHPSYLLLNDGKGSFTDGTESAGLSPKRNRRTYSSSFVDLDEDGDLDLLTVNDFSGIDVYSNDGTGRFTDVTASIVDETANFGMSHVFADFNRDGNMDFYVLGMSSTTARRLEAMQAGRPEFPKHQEMRMRMGYGNRMYLGSGDGTWKQAPFNDAVARTGWSWGVAALDFDNDADLDLYVANGHQSRTTAKDYCTTFWCHDIYTANSKPDTATAAFFRSIGMATAQEGISWNGFEHNNFFVQVDPDAYINAHYLMGVGFEFDSRAVVCDDIDADGRVDLMVVEAEHLDPGAPRGERLHLLRNEHKTDGHWVAVRLQPGRRSPYGARILVRTAEGTQQGVVVSGDSFRAQHAWTKHFGLGSQRRIEAIEVVWLDGTKSTLAAPAVNQVHVIQ